MIKHVQHECPDKYKSISESRLLIFNDFGIPVPLENVVVKKCGEWFNEIGHVHRFK